MKMCCQLVYAVSCVKRSSFAQILRLDGGSKRARLEAKVKAAQETSGGAGRDSLGVAESTVTAKWASDDEGSDDDFASEE